MGADDTTRRLAASIQRQLGKLPTFPTSRCIYRVPNRLRALKNEAYTPSTVSIGPYHRKNSKLLPMESHKLKYLETFLRHSQKNGNLNTYLQFVKDNETSILECYADPIKGLTCDEFVEMVLVDGAFIIELCRRILGICVVDRDDFIFNSPHLLECIMPDISLAENQLPFFVLQGLYEIAFRPGLNAGVPPFTDIACGTFGGSRTGNHFDTQGLSDPLHLLDLLRNRYLPSKPREEVTINNGNVDQVKMTLCPSVTRLREAGVRFQVARDAKRLLDIHFDSNSAVLKIPKINVDDGIEFELRNLVAFERCHVLDRYITQYRFFMDCLINTAKDVELLVGAGIIENWLGSEEEVADLFNNLGKYLTIFSERYYYANATAQLNAHCGKRWNKYRATLKHTYFKHPWAVLSVIYAAVLLILTIIQVVTGIFSVV